MASPPAVTFYYYDPAPDPDEHPLARLQPGDRVFAVQHVDPEHAQPGDPVTVIPIVVGAPPAPVPPTRWRRLWSRLTGRQLPEPDMVIRFVAGTDPGRPAA